MKQQINLPESLAVRRAYKIIKDELSDEVFNIITGESNIAIQGVYININLRLRIDIENEANKQANFIPRA
jgi:hypothetical protein